MFKFSEFLMGKVRLLSKFENLNDMILEADVLFLLPAAVLNVKNTDEIGSPASENAIEDLKNDS